MTSLKIMCVPSKDSDLIEFSLDAQWVTMDLTYLHVESEDTDQTEFIPRLM